MLLSKVQCIPSVQILERSHIDWANTETFSKWSRTLLVFLFVVFSILVLVRCIIVCIHMIIRTHICHVYIQYIQINLNYQIISIYKYYHTYVICLYMYIVRMYIYIHGIIWKDFWPPYAFFHPSHTWHCLGFHQLLWVNLSGFFWCGKGSKTDKDNITIEQSDKW